MLWKLECIVDGKKLGQVYAGLQGLVYNLSPPIPLRGAEKQNGVVKSTAPANGACAETIYNNLKKKNGLAKFRADAIKAAMKNTGYSEGSYSYAIKTLMRKKMLRRLSGGNYQLKARV